MGRSILKGNSETSVDKVTNHIMLLLDLIPSGPRMNKNVGQEYKENFQEPPPTGKELQEIQQREVKIWN